MWTWEMYFEDDQMRADKYYETEDEARRSAAAAYATLPKSGWSALLDARARNAATTSHVTKALARHGARPGRMHASAPGAALKIPGSSNGPPEPFCDRSKLRSARKLGLPDKAQNRYPGEEAMIIRNNLD
jgi:hypothetical protein